MTTEFKNIVWREGKYYVAQCLTVELSSFGNTKEEALKNLGEALDLYLEDVSDDSANSNINFTSTQKRNSFGTFNPF